MKIPYHFQYLYSVNRMHFFEYNFNKIKLDLQFNFPLYLKPVFNFEDSYLIQAISEFNYPTILNHKETVKRMNDGNCCYLGMIEEKPVAYYWIALNKFYIPYMNGTILLEQHQRYGFNAVVSPAYRRQGIFNQLSSLIFSDLNQQGVDAVIGAHMDWNKATQNANIKLGADYLGTVSYGYIGTIRYFTNTVKNIVITHSGSPLQLYARFLTKKLEKANAKP